MNKSNGETRDSGPLLNIKAVVTQTGLNPATIRAWERRYGLPRPTRTAGGHRQYSQRDVDIIMWLIARQDEGISISHSIDLWHSYIDKGEDPLQAGTAVAKKPAARVTPVFEGEQIDKLRNAWVSACLAYDRETAEQVLIRAFALYNPETICVELLQRGLVEVGNGWYNGEVTVQQEHFTSALSLQRVEMLISATPPPTRPERIIVATAPGDFHIFSSLLLTFLLRRRGWDVIYLGADVPADELESTIGHVQPELIIVSAQLLHTAATLKEITIVAQLYNVPLAFGGLVFNQTPELQQLIPGYYLGESLLDAVQWVSMSLNQRLRVSSGAEVSESYQGTLQHYHEKRATIESHVWGTFTASGKSTNHLSSINNDIAQTIIAALKLGEVRLLQSDISWIEHLLMGYRLPKEHLADFIVAYYEAARIHLGESASVIVDWLAQILITAKMIETE